MMHVNKVLTAALLKEPGKCPFCKSDQINAGDWDGGRTVHCTVECDGCGESWTEYYAFTGAIVTEEPEEEEEDE